VPNSAVKFIPAFEFCQARGVVDDVVVPQFELGHALDNPLVAEAVRLGCKVVSWYCPLPLVYLMTVNSHKAEFEVFDAFDGAVDDGNDGRCHGVVDSLDLPGDPVGPDVKVRAFREYREELADKVVVIQNRADSSVVKVIRQAESSRYFPEGRRRMRAKIARKMGGFYSCNGYLLSLTFDPKLISKGDAWKEVGKRGSKFINAVNMFRKRKGWEKVRGIRSVEEQPGTGYPHLHYAYPKLRYLAPIEKMVEWWGQAVNSVDFEYRDSLSPVGYVCKYISKLEGWSDEGLAEIWSNRSRVYSMSEDYYLVENERRMPEWVFTRTARLASAGRWLRELVDQYDTVLGVNDIAMKVYLDSS